MTKIDWRRPYDEKRTIRQGTSGFGMEEMPLSWADHLPKDGLMSLQRYVRSVIVADINNTPFPQIPVKIKDYIQGQIDKKGSPLEFAMSLIDYETVRRNVEHLLLHKIAKYELGDYKLNLMFCVVPDALKSEINDEESLLRWARSNPDYGPILGSKKAQRTQGSKARKGRSPNRSGP